VLDRYKSHPVNTADGVRIEFGDEWVHLRRSNTEPIIRIYAESSAAAHAESLAARIIEELKSLLPGVPV
jgi:phosphomannomutase